MVIQVNKHHAPYVLTKPIHPSQQLLREMEEGIIIRIDVILNFELERELLLWGFHTKSCLPVSWYPASDSRLIKRSGNTTPRNNNPKLMSFLL